MPTNEETHTHTFFYVDFVWFAFGEPEMGARALSLETQNTSNEIWITRTFCIRTE